MRFNISLSSRRCGSAFALRTCAGALPCSLPAFDCARVERVELHCFVHFAIAIRIDLLQSSSDDSVLGSYCERPPHPTYHSSSQRLHVTLNVSIYTPSIWPQRRT